MDTSPAPEGSPRAARAPATPVGAASRPLRIANCSGFYGDRLSAAREMVEGGPIDVLTGDWLAELTMLILARTQAKRAGGGYARSFVTQMEQVLGACMDRGIKVVSNAGGLDPPGCAEAVREVADRLGLSPAVAYVAGDDLLRRLGELAAAGVDLAHLDTGEPVGDVSRFVSANAYLGCWGIVEALQRGADIVVTGRTTDAAVVCGPAAWHHGWARDDWDALAGAVVAGHVIECGTQATGGNYSFFAEVPGMTRVGFPWAEIAADGSSVIGKHDDTGGAVSIGTVTSQLLYEIAGPAYLGPDVTARFDTVRLQQDGPDRVRVHGVRGEPPPPTLKVAMNELGGYRNDVAVALTGLDVDAKAQLVEDAFWEACPYKPEDFASVTTRVVRTDKADPATNEEAVAAWRLTVKDPDERKVGRAVSNAMVELGLATIPGFFGLSGGPREARPYGVFRPALVPAELVPQHVVVIATRERTVVDSVAPPAAAETVDVEPAPGPEAGAPGGPTVRAPLGHVVGARSGDKAGNANLGVFARTDESWAWLDGFLTVDRLRDLLPETADLAVDRYRLANLRALNVVIHGLLQEGVAASTRQDGQAKSLGEWLRARVVDVPAVLLPDAP
ncbi:MAG TPA: acyclic terpene utilization AtuA family protein [Acidimicrobiales bacterium]|nr:acyclic terpene utilization AtuA family protein [Acidimicrobiales bacterium]